MHTIREKMKPTFNKILSFFLLLALVFTVAQIASAVAPNPGHDFTAVSGGVVTGDVLYGSAADTLSALSGVATGNALISGGVSTAPSWGKVGLTTHVSGILPTANGGTGMAFFTAAGPTAARIFTFPDAAATVLTTNTLVTVAQGGTGLNTLTANNVILGAGASVPTFVAPGTAGNILQSNGTTWVSASGGVLNGIQTIVNPTTSYTPTSGTTEAIIEMWGGGGAGGSCTNVAGCAAGGGGSGGYAMYYFTGIGAGPYTVAVNAGGTAVAGATGNAGGTTTFNTGALTITANGGGGGLTVAGTAVIKYVSGGAGGAISTNGTVNGAGMPGGSGMTSTVVTTNSSGFGGSTGLGGGGVAVTGNISATAVAGVAAVANTGSGGSGGKTGTGTAAAGGAGAAGRMVIHEYR